MRCRVCGAADPIRLWENPGATGTWWYLCAGCASHSHDIDPDAVVGDYLTEAYHTQRDSPEPFDHGTEPLTANVEWFDRFRPAAERPRFLDVGCLTGAALRAMEPRGWDVHGFDVNPHAAVPGKTTIFPHFTASLFGERFDAVLCREVIEHVTGWRALLMELYRVTKPDGLVQIQTPRPTATPWPNVHQRHHLQIFSPAALRDWCEWAGLRPIDRLEWENGQALMLRRAA